MRSGFLILPLIIFLLPLQSYGQIPGADPQIPDEKRSGENTGADHSTDNTRPLGAHDISNTDGDAPTGIDLGLKLIALKNVRRVDSAKLLPKWDEGMIVSSVNPLSAAGKAGVEEGDIITRIDETKIQDDESLKKLLGSVKAGKAYTLTFFRFGGIHVGMSKEEMAKFVKTNNGTADLIDRETLATAIGEIANDIPTEGEAQYQELKYVLPDLDDDGNQKANYTTTTTPRSNLIGTTNEVKTTAEPLFVNPTSYAIMQGGRVTAIFTLGERSLVLDSRTFVIDKCLWRKTSVSMTAGATGTIANVPRAADKFLSSWVNDSIIQRAAFNRSKSDEAFLGVYVRDFSQSTGLPLRGAEVVFVYPNSPASRASIKEGDIITKWSDREIGGRDDLAKLRSLGSGIQGTIAVMRKFDSVYKEDQTAMVLASKSEFAVDMPPDVSPELRQLIEDGEIERQHSLQAIDESISGKSSAAPTPEKLAELKQLKSQLIKSRGNYAPSIEAQSRSIGSFRSAACPLTAHVFQIVGNDKAIVKAQSTDGKSEMFLWWTTDIAKAAVGTPVSIDGVWRVTNTQPYSAVDGKIHTILSIEKFQFDVFTQGRSNAVPTVPQPQTAKDKSVSGI